MLYGRDTENFFYDVTNYYFHTDDETELIAKGYSKDRKGKPIIQMGLLLDNNGLPITYKLFKGNTTDFETLLPVLDEVKKKYNLKRAIVVADKGLNSGSNKAYNIINGDGYIFSRSLRGTKADKEVKVYALDENYGSMKYIQGMKLNKETGELTVAKKDIIPRLNEALIKEEKKFDGYYSIVTSELDMPEAKVIERYRGLWKIEETFKVTKTNLETRPIYLKKDEHIETHFLTCFISLLILRILEMKMLNKYPTGKIIDSLKKSNVCLLNMNRYKGVYYDDILEEIDKGLGTSLNRKYLTLDDIKKMAFDTK